MILPQFSTDARAISSRGKSLSCRSTSSDTSRASVSLVVTSTALASLSCSAWESRSAATVAASALSSAMTSISLGPATMSIPTVPNTAFFASAT